MTTLSIQTPRAFLPLLDPSRYKGAHGFTAARHVVKAFTMTKRPDLTERNTTHGLSRIALREYRSWKDMRARCRNPNDSDFRDYGARGVSIEPQWEDFEVFFRDMGERPQNQTLDRIDVNGNYGPRNCRWASHKTQANNKRSNHKIEINGIVQTLAQWCERYGIEPSKVRYRLKQGWPAEKAFSSEDFRRVGS